MNKAISACRFLKVQGSYMRVSTVLGAIFLTSIMMNEAISACRILYVGFYCIRNEAISACRILYGGFYCIRWKNDIEVGVNGMTKQRTEKDPCGLKG